MSNFFDYIPSYSVLLFISIVIIWLLLLGNIKFRKNAKITEKIAKETLIESTKACFGFAGGISSIYYSLSKQFIFGMSEEWLRIVIGIVGIWLSVESFYILFGEKEKTKK